MYVLVRVGQRLRLDRYEQSSHAYFASRNSQHEQMKGATGAALFEACSSTRIPDDSPPPPLLWLLLCSSGKQQVHTFLDAGDLGRLSQTSKHMLSLCFDEVSLTVMYIGDTCTCPLALCVYCLSVCPSWSVCQKLVRLRGELHNQSLEAEKNNNPIMYPQKRKTNPCLGDNP